MPRVNGSTRKGVGPWTPNQVRLIADTVNSVIEGRESGTSGDVSQFRAFLARITGGTLRAGRTTAWLYDWEEVFVLENGAYITAGGAETRRRASSQFPTYGQALNGNEALQTINGNDLVVGPGITVANIPAGFTYNRIANNVVVLMYAGQRVSGSPLFWFYAANPIEGSCQVA